MTADHAPAMIWISGQDKLFTWFNKSWLDFTGRTVEQETGNGWIENVHPSDRKYCEDIYVKAFDARMKFRIEYRIKRHDGLFRWVSDFGKPRYNGKEFAGFIGSCIDITEHKQAEQSHELLHALVERSTDAFEIIDAATGRFVDANARAHESLGYTREEFLELTVPDIAPKTDPATYKRRFSQLHDNGELTFQDIHRHKDGTTFPVEITLSSITLDRPYVLAIGRDISERKQAEAAMRQMARRLAEVQEQERIRFSRELHDQTGQEITALHLHLQTLKDDPNVSAPLRERLILLAGLTERLSRSVHHIAWQLRPPVIDDLGLDKALSRHATDWSEQTHIPLDYQSSGVNGRKRADAMVEITLYRIAQEALHNIWKYARARHVSMLLQWWPEEIRLIVEDDGQGFQMETVLEKLPEQCHLGLAGMYERAALVGGTLEIESAPGKGTSIFVRVLLTLKL